MAGSANERWKNFEHVYRNQEEEIEIYLREENAGALSQKRVLT